MSKFGDVYAIDGLHRVCFLMTLGLDYKYQGHHQMALGMSAKDADASPWNTQGLISSWFDPDGLHAWERVDDD